MRKQNLVDSISIPGHFTQHADAVALIAVNNDLELSSLTYEQEKEAAEHLGSFLLQVIPAGVLASTIDNVAGKVQRLGELGDAFDDISLDKILTSVDPALNAYIVDKHAAWNGGVATTEVLLAFIERAINYAKDGHVERAVDAH
jgi:hypothetical protein